MLHVNRVTLLGYAGRDPEVRTPPDGAATARFSLATTRKWSDRDGKPAEATEWHPIAVYGPAVEAAQRLVTRGAAVLVEGPLSRREYRDREGNLRQIAEIVVAGREGMVNLVSPTPRGDSRDEAQTQEAEDGG